MSTTASELGVRFQGTQGFIHCIYCAIFIVFYGRRAGTEAGCREAFKQYSCMVENPHVLLV
jgi:hypothetical protein